MLIQSHAAMLALSLSAVAVAQNSPERVRIENSGYIVEVLRANGANALEIKLFLDNHSGRSIDETWYPVLGGITGFGSREETQETINVGGWSTNTHLFRHFPSQGGGALGIPWAENYWSYPQAISMP